MTAARYSLLTATWAQDYDRFCLLRTSLMEMGLAEEVQHVAVVHTEDVPQFEQLKGQSGLTILPTSAVLEPWFERRRAAAAFSRSQPRHYVRGGHIPGWFAQQVVKLSAAAMAETDAVLVLDSDMVQIAPLGEADVLGSDGRARLFVEEDRRGDGSEAWSAAAAAALRVDPELVAGQQFIHWPYAISRPVVRALVAELGRGRPTWQEVMLRSNLFEYPTYAIWALHREERPLTASTPLPHANFSDFHQMWDFRREARDVIDSRLTPFLSVQSRLHIPPDSYADVVAQAWRP